MCGIAGVMKMKDEAITQQEVQLLAAGIEYRGNQATGIGAMVEGEVHFVKAAEKARDFLTKSEVTSWLDEFVPKARIVLIHTRAATKGSPSRNENNHPIYADKCAVVHNGVLSNDDEKFVEWKLERKCETDSDIIRAALDNWGFTEKGIRKLATLSGSAAIAAIHPDWPEYLLLARSGNPLTVGITEKKIYFSSDKKAIHAAAKGMRKIWGIWAAPRGPEVCFTDIPLDTAWLIGPEGLEWHQEFKLASYYVRSSRGVIFPHLNRVNLESVMFYCETCQEGKLEKRVLDTKGYISLCGKCHEPMQGIEVGVTQ